MIHHLFCYSWKSQVLVEDPFEEALIPDEGQNSLLILIMHFRLSPESLKNHSRFLKTFQKI